MKVYKQRIIGPFIVDFYCAPARLVIEVDGSQHFNEQGLAYDKERTTYLQSLGLQVVRYTNRDIDTSFLMVCNSIRNHIQNQLAEQL